MTDRVKMYRSESTPYRLNGIRNVLENAGKRYVKIRADLEVLGSERIAIVGHIKSYPDWEYFVDNFTEDEHICASGLFNYVKVIKNDNSENVLMYFTPNYDIHDKNNIYFGQCTFDDILNIEEIIEKRKLFYKDVQ